MVMKLEIIQVKYWMILNRETGQAWSNEFGWVAADSDSYDLFEADEVAKLNLPIGGEWKFCEE